MKTPVVFIVFNRPITTKKVLAEIAKVKPEKLFIIADGPRESRHGERNLCAEVKRIIENGIDWECDLRTNYSKANLGCEKRITSGLNWVFDQVEEAIVLEDDCLPNPTFFPFCEELLIKYKDDPKIMHITGNNFYKPDQIEESYYYSRYAHCWGWATWRRAWKLYDGKMSFWEGIKQNKEFTDYIGDKLAIGYWSKIFEETKRGKMDSWAYPWAFTCFYHKGLTIIPKVNLVSNIGFDHNATHTKQADCALGDLPVFEMNFPLKHPKSIIRNAVADQYVDVNAYQMKTFLCKALKEATRVVKDILCQR